MSIENPLSVHVLNVSTGDSATGMFIVLERYEDTDHDWQTIGEAKTDDAGQAMELIPAGALKEGLYRLTFDTDAYFGEREIRTFYSSVSINFQVTDAQRQYHIPLLLSPYGYSTHFAR